MKYAVDSSGCWIYLGRLDECGYGRTGKNNKGAHRVSYERVKGKIPEGLELDHLCRVRNCINPDHLEAVTHKENVRRGFLSIVTAERQMSKTHCPQGHEYSESNTYVAPKAYSQNGRQAKTPARHCKICKLEAHKRWRTRRLK